MIGLKEAQGDKSAVSIVAVDATSWTRVARRFGKHVVEWLKTMNFRGAPGQFIVIPDDKGAMRAVLVGIGDGNERYALSSLPMNLPAGTYRLADEGATLNLGGNLWKRASLGESYTITENTKLTFTYTIGTALPEIVAVGFDDDNSPFETADKSVYQIAGTENRAFSPVRSRPARCDPGVASIMLR